MHEGVKYYMLVFFYSGKDPFLIVIETPVWFVTRVCLILLLQLCFHKAVLPCTQNKHRFIMGSCRINTKPMRSVRVM